MMRIAHAAFLCLSVAACLACEARSLASPASAPADMHGFSAPGRIEGATETIEIAAAIDGLLEAVPVTEGQRVANGDVLARVACGDLHAAAAAAAAEERAATMRWRILQIGTRAEDLAVVRARRDAAAASRARAAEFEQRAMQLWDERLIPADDRDRARREREVADALLLAAEAEYRRAEAGPLPEELQEAAANADRASARHVELRERLAKCVVRAPGEGTVLKKRLFPGEIVTLAAARSILTFASLSTFTVRAEVDEHDIDRVKEQMRVIVTSPAWGQRQYRGTVISLADVMGRRQVRSGDPAEKSDRDIREVIVRLEDGERFVVGLRVEVLFPDAARP
jgi:HlyD family secretion protein